MNSLENIAISNNRPYYDRLYFWWARDKSDDIPIFLKLLEKKPHGRVLDLGGGFGRLAQKFAHVGREVTVVDKSSQMLRLGEQHISSDQSEVKALISWSCADITSPLDELPLNWFAVAICAHNAINEITEETSLNGLFANIGNHLEYEGIALITAIQDVEYKNIKIFEFLDVFTDPDNCEWMVSTVTVPCLENTRKHQLTFFYEKYVDGRMEERLARTIERRVWTIGELEIAAKKAGMVHLENLDSEKIFAFQKLS